MKVLALYLKEETTRRINGRKKSVWRIPGADLEICRVLESLGHKVDKKSYNPYEKLRLDKRYDVIFNLCDGLENDNDFVEFRVLKELEKTKIPFTGNSLKTIKLCNDKRKIKKMLVKNGILTPGYQVFKSEKQSLNSSLTFPLIVKPVCADAAVGIYADSVVNNEKELRKKIRRVLVQHEQPAALVSEYIEGRDLTIPVMGKKRVVALNPTELRYMRSYKNRPNILSYGAKWHKKRPIYKDCITLVKGVDRRFTKKELALVKKTAKKVYQVAGCRGYATVDARLRDGKLYVIEINPNCWVSKDSDTARSLKNVGVRYPEFINRLVKIALEK